MNQTRAAWTLLVIGVLVCIAGCLRFRSNMEDVFQWLPDHSDERQLYDDFVTKFGSDDFVVLSWPSCDLSNPQASQLAEKLRSPVCADILRDAVSGQDLIRRLKDASRLKPKATIDRFRGVYFGGDGHRTCVVVSLTELGMTNRLLAVAMIRDVAQKVLGDGVDELVVGGYPQVGAYGDQVIRESILWSVGPACLLSTIMAWMCLRTFQMTLSILAIAGMSAGLSIAAVTLSGATWGGISSVIPTLTYIMTVSGCLHLANYSRAFEPPQIARQVLGTAWKPCVFSSVTTAAGMLSLCRSEFSAVREFGLYSACGVLISLLCQLVLMPVALEHSGGRRTDGPVDLRPWQARLLEVSLLKYRFIVVASVLLMLLFGWGLSHVAANLEVERVFRNDSPVTRDIAWLERELGPLEQTELVVSFPQVASNGFYDRVSIVRNLQAEVRALPAVSQTVSLTNSLPQAPSGSGIRKTAARAMLRQRLKSRREELGQSAYLAIGEEESWRISIRIPFLNSTDYGGLERQVRRSAEQTLSAYPEHEAAVEYTGVSHLYHVAQEAVVDDLFYNFAFAFVLIAPLMVLAVRSVMMGLWAMLPNVAPAVLVFGAIGIVGYEIDIGIAMTASVALGIAVDDTTHFLIRFRELCRDRSSREALTLAYHQCSAAMMHTTLIAGCGLLAFTGGHLVAMTRFAIVLVALVAVALVCDLILLPALLCSLGFVAAENPSVE